MIRANENLAILSAEAPISSPLMTDGSAFVQLEEEFRQAFEMTVIDLPRNMLINFPHLLADVNVVVVASELTLSGARDAIRLLSWLKTNASHAQTLVIATKVHVGTGEISKGDFEASIERKIDFTIPFDAKAASNAAKLGQTFVSANRSSKAGAVLRDLAEAVLATGGERDGDTPKGAKEGKSAGVKTSLLSKFDLKKMLPSKAKASAPA
jgi:pilus assembly protein CpaE